MESWGEVEGTKVSGGGGGGGRWQCSHVGEDRLWSGLRQGTNDAECGEGGGEE